ARRQRSEASVLRGFFDTRPGSAVGAGGELEGALEAGELAADVLEAAVEGRAARDVEVPAFEGAALLVERPADGIGGDAEVLEPGAVDLREKLHAPDPVA